MQTRAVHMVLDLQSVRTLKLKQDPQIQQDGYANLPCSGVAFESGRSTTGMDRCNCVFGLP